MDYQGDERGNQTGAIKATSLNSHPEAQSHINDHELNDHQNNGFNTKLL
jgi:hypothetical protein